MHMHLSCPNNAYPGVVQLGTLQPISFVLTTSSFYRLFLTTSKLKERLSQESRWVLIASLVLIYEQVNFPLNSQPTLVRVERFHSRGERLCKFIRKKERPNLHKRRVELPQDWFGQGPPHMSAGELRIPVVWITHSWNCIGIVIGLNGKHYALLAIGK